MHSCGGFCKGNRPADETKTSRLSARSPLPSFCSVGLPLCSTDPGNGKGQLQMYQILSRADRGNVALAVIVSHCFDDGFVC